MSWGKKIETLKEAVKAETTKVEAASSSMCIHGEDNCARCATNDFDNTEAVKNVWVDMEDVDVKRVVYSLPSEVQSLMHDHPGNVVLAGGYIRAMVAGEQPSDIDLFVNNKTTSKSWLVDAYLISTEGDQNWITKAVEGKRLEIQTVWRYPFEQAYQVIEQFDYIVTKAAIWFDNGDKDTEPNYLGICHSQFYKDIARKALTYDCVRDTEYLLSIPRLMKYILKGYIIDPHSLAQVIAKTCLSLDLTNGFEGIEKQLESVYALQSNDTDWAKLTKKYVKQKPKPKERETYYGSGS